MKACAGAALAAVMAAQLGCGWAASRERELDRPFSLAPVDEVEVILLGAHRPTATVVARGTLPDACTHLDDVRRPRSGRDFEFMLATRRQPGADCDPQPQPFEKTLLLYLEIADYGQYRAIVNGVSRSFYVSSDPLNRDGVTGFEMGPMEP